MAKRKKSKAKVKASGRRGGKLPAKRCPKPGVMVSTRAGLIGVTAGTCERRRVDVALAGQMGMAQFTRGELRKVPKGQQARIAKELAKVRRIERGGAAAMPRAEVMNFPKSRPVPYGGHMYGHDSY